MHQVGKKNTKGLSLY